MASTSNRPDDGGLARRYRRLLVCYPRRFRQQHGDQLVGTLLEMAAPGRTRPTIGDVAHLTAGGLRVRLRLPANRPLALLGAVLITVIAGAFGGLAAWWAAVALATPLPDGAAVATLTNQVAPGGHDYGWFRSSSMSWWISQPTPRAAGLVEVPAWAPGAARDQLIADGWHVGAINDGAYFAANRDGVRMSVSAYPSGDNTTIWVNLTAGITPFKAPAVIAGALLGALIGWMVTAAGAYRMRRVSALRRRMAAGLSGLGIAALIPPAFGVSINLAQTLHLPASVVETVHETFNGTQYLSSITSTTFAQLAAGGIALIAAAWAALIQRTAFEPDHDDMPAMG